jgi:hypothetical protein
MALSKRVVETLLDLVEIKLSCIEVYDRDDSRELEMLERCRRELQELIATPCSGGSADPIVAFPAAHKVGRRAAV